MKQQPIVKTAKHPFVVHHKWFLCAWSLIIEVYDGCWRNVELLCTTHFYFWGLIDELVWRLD